MTRVEELRKLIVELRESGAEPEDISQVAQELNMELQKARTQVPLYEIKAGGGKSMRKKKELNTND